MKSLHFIFIFTLISCSYFEKDNEVKETYNYKDTIRERYEHFKDIGTNYLHDGFHGVGDAAIFTCIRNLANASDVDVGSFHINGKIVRHPIYKDETKKGPSATPTSRDMGLGAAICVYALSLKDKDKALEHIEEIIKYGRDHTKFKVWNFCDDNDMDLYDIDDKTFVGRCIFSPELSSLFYDLATSIGYDCDLRCQASRKLIPQIPSNMTGFQRHLQAWSIFLKGRIDGSINDYQLSFLKKFRDAEPRNALYEAMYQSYKDGDMGRATELLWDDSLFRKDGTVGFCSDYLFQRDERRNEDLDVFIENDESCIKYYHADTKELTKECGVHFKGETKVKKFVYNDDWLPCDKISNTPLTEWVITAAIILGDI